MSTGKLIIAFIVTAMLFVFFICYAFQSLQSTSLNLPTQDIESMENSFIEELDFLDQYSQYEFIEDFYLINYQIVLLDHINEKAILWNDLNNNENKQLVYDQIPDNIKFASSYLVDLNNHKTLFINCDALLGNTQERIIVDCYKYLKLKQTKLNPKEINYFPSVNENIYERFIRNQMLECLIKAYNENKSLEDFKFYFEMWQLEMGESYKQVAEYDWYEGAKEYIHVKAKQVLEEDFRVYEYIESKRNDLGYFDKEDEYPLIGLLMILYAEKNSKMLNQPYQIHNDIYRNLLYKTPYISREIDPTAFETFKEQYDTYNQEMEYIYKTFDFDKQEVSIYYDDIITETYDRTFMINKNYFIYKNYRARLKGKGIISKEYVIVQVLPYKIQYFFID